MTQTKPFNFASLIITGPPAILFTLAALISEITVDQKLVAIGIIWAVLSTTTILFGGEE